MILLPTLGNTLVHKQAIDLKVVAQPDPQSVGDLASEMQDKWQKTPTAFSL